MYLHELRNFEIHLREAKKICTQSVMADKPYCSGEVVIIRQVKTVVCAQ